MAEIDQKEKRNEQTKDIVKLDTYNICCFVSLVLPIFQYQVGRNRYYLYIYLPSSTHRFDPS